MGQGCLLLACANQLLSPLSQKRKTGSSMGKSRGRGGRGRGRGRSAAGRDVEESSDEEAEVQQKSGKHSFPTQNREKLNDS